MNIEIFQSILIIFGIPAILAIIAFSNLSEYYHLKNKQDSSNNTKSNFITTNNALHNFLVFSLCTTILIIAELIICLNPEYDFNLNRISTYIVGDISLFGIPLICLINSFSKYYFYYKLKSIGKEKTLTKQESQVLKQYYSESIITFIIFIIIIAFYIYVFLSLIASPPTFM